MILSLENTWLDPLSDIIQGLLVHQTVLGPILLLTVEESGIPMPVPGDIIVAYTGYNISRGFISLPVAFVSILLAILIGSTILYMVSYRWGSVLVAKFSRFLHVHPDYLPLIEKMFKKYGVLVIIFGRHIPGFRIPITIFAGMSKVRYRTFIISTFISTCLWVWFYLNFGARLGPRISLYLHHGSHFWLYPIAVVVVLFGVIFYLRKPKKKQ